MARNRRQIPPNGIPTPPHSPVQGQWTPTTPVPPPPPPPPPGPGAFPGAAPATNYGIPAAPPPSVPRGAPAAPPPGVPAPGAPVAAPLPVPPPASAGLPPTTAPVQRPIAAPDNDAVESPFRRRSPQAEPIEEHTVLASRRKKAASLRLPEGKVIPLEADTVVIGRKLSRAAHPVDVQLINVDDPTRTVSKFHATLTRTPEGWNIRDEDSTNGIYVIASDGSEVELEGAGPVDGTFILGDLEFVLESDD